MTNIFKLDWRDVLNSCVSGAIVAILGYVGNLTSLTNLDYQQLVSVVVLSVVASLTKKFGTDSDGKFMGKV